MNRRQFLTKSFLGSAALLSLEETLAAQDVSIPKLEITGIKIHQLRQEMPEPMGYCCARGAPLGFTSTGASVIEVSTNEGITGWGDGQWGGDVLRQNKDRVIGRSPFEVEAIFDELTELQRVPFHTIPRNAPPPGGLDVAIWDIVGKAVGKPLSKILGKQYRDRVMPYASAGYRKDWPDLEAGFAKELYHWTKEVGFRAAKMKTGYGPSVDVRVIGAVRKAIGEEIHLGVDSGTPGAYDDGTAVMLGRQLEQFNLEFWEEPINKWDLEGYARLKNALRIPLASGEFLPVDWLIENYVQNRLMDIVQPDIMDCGLTGGKRITNACTVNRVRLVPHSWGTPIRIVSEMHWVACIPELYRAWNPPPALFELHLPHESPAWGLTTRRVEVDKSDGKIAVPIGPGLGIEINQEELERYRTNLINI